MVRVTFRSAAVGVFLAVALSGCSPEPDLPEEQGGAGLHNSGAFLPNHLPVKDEDGFAASWSTTGRVAVDGAVLHAQGTNGRHCASCHSVDDGWSASAATLQRMFDETGGLDPVFNLLDADRPNAFVNMDAL